MLTAIKGTRIPGVESCDEDEENESEEEEDDDEEELIGYEEGYDEYHEGEDFDLDADATG